MDSNINGAFATFLRVALFAMYAKATALAIALFLMWYRANLYGEDILEVFIFILVGFAFVVLLVSIKFFHEFIGKMRRGGLLPSH